MGVIDGIRVGVLVDRIVLVGINVTLGQCVFVGVAVLVGVEVRVIVEVGAGVGGSPITEKCPERFQINPLKIWTS